MRSITKRLVCGHRVSILSAYIIPMQHQNESHTIHVFITSSYFLIFLILCKVQLFRIGFIHPNVADDNDTYIYVYEYMFSYLLSLFWCKLILILSNDVVMVIFVSYFLLFVWLVCRWQIVDIYWLIYTIDVILLIFTSSFKNTSQLYNSSMILQMNHICLRPIKKNTARAVYVVCCLHLFCAIIKRVCTMSLSSSTFARFKSIILWPIHTVPLTSYNVALILLLVLVQEILRHKIRQ